MLKQLITALKRWMYKHGLIEIKNPKKTRDPLKLREHLVQQFKDFGVCPCCGDQRMMRGPEGGCSMNVMCASCGSRFNWTQMGELTLLDWTHGPQDDIWGRHERLRYPEQTWVDKVEGALTR